MESGLINSSFESETLDGDGYFCNILSGESRDPEKLRSAVLDEIERVKREGLSKQDFEDLKKAKYASAIRIFTSVQGCASLMLNAHMTDTKPFDAVEVLKTLTFEDAAGYIDELFAVENFAISIIEPL
jgi:predicted Zn-dependent peptidase